MITAALELNDQHFVETRVKLGFLFDLYLVCLLFVE